MTEDVRRLGAVRNQKQKLQQIIIKNIKHQAIKSHAVNKIHYVQLQTDLNQTMQSLQLNFGYRQNMQEHKLNT